LNAIGKVSHVLLIVSDVSIEVQDSWIKKCIEGKLITGELIIKARRITCCGIGVKRMWGKE
jgi:hypothetical protein